MPAAAQREYGPDFSPQHEFYLSFQPVLRDFSGGVSANWNTGTCALALFDAAEYFPRATGAIQPQASCGRRRH